ncbi:response regulator transcription factor [Patescibacteria group bacterium]|nr:response regulator transcription factor [Patescibacteria group bacterium]
MKLLVVEDEHKIANSIKKGLEQESYAVDVAYDGENGFDLASSEEYDVIILDLMLPKMDGLTICKKLREEKNKHAPILILTSKGEIDDKVVGLNAGADDYLAKPFAFSELLARIKALSRRPKQTLNSVLQVGKLTLDTSTYETRRDGKLIELSKKEYALLEYMMRHKGKVLTKDQIINNVWDYDADVLPNTVEVYVGYLRNKIDPTSPPTPLKLSGSRRLRGASKKEESLIKTVRGFGYKLG